MQFLWKKIVICNHSKQVQKYPFCFLHKITLIWQKYFVVSFECLILSRARTLYIYIYKWLCHFSVILPFIPCICDFFSLSLRLVFTNFCLYTTLHTNKLHTHDFFTRNVLKKCRQPNNFCHFCVIKNRRGIFFFDQSDPDQPPLDSATCTIFIFSPRWSFKPYFLSLLVVQTLFSLLVGRSNLIFSLI